jgi:energy-converting hydrogenase Eha subunit C
MRLSMLKIGMLKLIVSMKYNLDDLGVATSLAEMQKLDIKGI